MSEAQHPESGGETEAGNTPGTEQNTRERILDAAAEVFYSKGYAGARMHEIAERAQINKAMLHYYFGNKETLFEQIFLQGFFRFQARILPILADERLGLEDKIRRFAEYYIDTVSQYPYLPLFILSELRLNPQRMVEILKRRDNHSKPYIRQILNYMDGTRPAGVEPFELFINLLALCVFPFIGRPILQHVFDLSDDQYDAFIERRRTTIPAFVLRALHGSPPESGDSDDQQQFPFPQSP